ncbi:winged helix-turn-helix domain-containing protein, partial [Gelidibacter sp.]|uniref:winged helix-turn-helix domain-containing protein n=1 Tax=Gelidibacter sp. TaxID=2018083 RepID=UPI003267A28F
MIQEIPKFHETFNSILQILSDREIIHTREMQKRVIEKYYSHLPKELLEEKTKSGEILINNRIAWGKSYLKKGGFIHYPTRGHVQITDKGFSQKNRLSLKDLEEETSLIDFYQTETDKKSPELKQISNASPQDLIDEGFNQIEDEVKNDLLEKLKIIDPYYFEKVILILL